MKEISGTGWMDPNVLLKAFCATECNKANTKTKATEEGEKLRIRANKGLVVRIKNFYNSNKKDKPILRRAKKKKSGLPFF